MSPKVVQHSAPASRWKKQDDFVSPREDLESIFSESKSVHLESGEFRKKLEILSKSLELESKSPLSSTYKKRNDRLILSDNEVEVKFNDNYKELNVNEKKSINNSIEIIEDWIKNENIKDRYFIENRYYIERNKSLFIEFICTLRDVSGCALFGALLGTILHPLFNKYYLYVTGYNNIPNINLSILFALIFGMIYLIIKAGKE